MDATIVTVISDAQFDMPPDYKPPVSHRMSMNMISRMAKTGLPVIVLHNNATSTTSCERVMGDCEELGVRYVRKSHNTYYGGAINALANEVDTEAMIYVSSRRSRIHRSEFVDALLSPLENNAVGMSGSVQPCNLSAVAVNHSGFADVHIQGAIWGARAKVIRDVPFGNEFPQIYSDVHHGLKLRRKGYELASARGIKAIAGGVVRSSLTYHAISDYRDWGSLGPWKYNFGHDQEVGVLGNEGGPSVHDDARPSQFLECFPDAKDVVEIGSFEGNHTCQIAGHVRSLTTIEGRHKNQDKAEFVKEWFDIRNVTPVVADARHTKIPQCDAIMCSGVLYHVDNPVQLLEKLSEASRNLFLWTHISDGYEIHERVAGKWMPEGGFADMLSGLQGRSFWLTEESLMLVLHGLGYVVNVIARENADGMRSMTLKCVRQ